MSNRLGNPNEVIIGAAALGAATGRAMSLGGAGNQWVTIPSILLTYVATAQAGSRVAVIQIKDGAGNILWSVAASANITAGQTARLALGGGVAAGNAASPPHIYVPLPDGFSCPANSTVTVFDNANIDSTDTIAMNAVISY